jgi:indole-3-glycerol phosphate synthase
MPSYLDAIIAAHREAAGADRRDLRQLRAQAEAGGPARGFARALVAAKGAGRPAVIAEVKRQSPLKGVLAPGLVPGVLAKAYASAGAACLSVITDTQFFGGAASDLGEARAAIDIPVLRKDFTVCEADVCDAKIMGADAVLLIVRALCAGELHDLLGLAAALGLDALVEVHDEAEAAVAVEAGATLIGVNQRDLATFEVDTARAERVARMLPTGVVRVAESGIRTPADITRLARAGFDAVLIGEALVTAADPGEALAQLLVAAEDGRCP